MRLATLAALIMITGCSTLNNTEKGALVGTGMGAVVGTAIGAATGNPRTGAALGALGGAVAGGAIGNAEDERENKQAIAQAVYERDAAASKLGMTDVVTLVQQGTDKNVIINQIRSTGSAFTLSTADIQYLTQQQVPPEVITCMQTSRGKVMAPRPVVIRDEPVVIVERPWYPYRPYHYGPRFGFTYCR